MGIRENLPDELQDKLDSLKKLLSACEKIAVAFSGGVDSTLLLVVTHEVLGENMVGIFVDSPLHPARERIETSLLAKKAGVKLITLKIDVLNGDAFRNNPANRCYLCKGLVFDEIIRIAGSMGYNTIVDGSNQDDLSDYRPGVKALRERGVRSPLQEVSLTKNEIRTLSKYYNLTTWDKDALACLATRIPTGEEVNEHKLKMIDRAEESLINRGFRNVRARHLGDTVRLEVRPDLVARLSSVPLIDEVVKNMKEIGFQNVIINPAGYQQGSMNAS